MHLDSSPALRLAWWGTAWLCALVSTDELLDAVRGEDAQHLVALPDGGTTGLAIGLGSLRSGGAHAFGLACPVAGDLTGLGGPADLNRAAVEAGEAVLALGAGVALVPQRTGAAVVWEPFEAARRPTPDLGEADRGLRAALTRAAGDLAALDVARWRPEVADELMNLRHRPAPLAPAGTPARCVDLLARAEQAAGIVELALADDGGAVSAGEIAERRAALLPLARAARHAVVAAGSPDGWPD